MTHLRTSMVDQLVWYGIRDARVLDTMRAIPRHEFVPEAIRPEAYMDRPLPIGLEQTISQPFIVAHMTELAEPQPGDKVLDVGTGSGYQAAVLSTLVDRVYSIEILCPLADQARARLERLGHSNVEVRCGDGYAGWPEQAPFELIIVAAAAPEIPGCLVEQLAAGGRLVIPVGPDGEVQQLVVLEKGGDGTVTRRSVGSVRFVPMTGEAQRSR